ncbi:LysR substrate-binding domain-containing protein, partial [Pseudomonas viridiflava]
TLACSSGVAALWLGPLLGRYRDEFPGVDIRLRVVDGLDSLIRAEFDLALYFLRESPPAGLDSRLLFAESVNAYCSPDYLNGQLLKPAQLLDYCLL